MPNVKKQDITNLIDIVLSDLEKSKFINDKFYSESKAKSMIQRGNSINKIRNYLLGKGINSKYIKETVEKINDENSDQDFFLQLNYVKKRIGPARVDDNRRLFYKKIFRYLQEMDLILKLQKKLWISKRMTI